MTSTTLDPEQAKLLIGQLDQVTLYQEALAHPAGLLRHMRCFDERKGEAFAFNMDDPEPWRWTHANTHYHGQPWGWQRPMLDFAMRNRRTIYLKARQIGVTWVFCGLGVWHALMHPGKRVLYYRQREEDAIDLVRRSWFQFNSLPAIFKEGVEVTKPSRGSHPHGEIELTFPDGRQSRIVGMTSASSSGHGSTGGFVLLDEFSRIDRADSIMTAVSSVVGDQDGQMVIVSTANGVSNETTGEGNVFHRLWVTAEDTGLGTFFLPWHLHPDRDQHWFDNSPEVQMLLPHQRAEQYPDNPQEAFTFSQAHYFDGESMHWYNEEGIREPEIVGDFRLITPTKARFLKRDSGMTDVYEQPKPGHKYAIGADVATGKGQDYSSAFVIDLDELRICAEFHGKLPTDVYAEQLFFLGQWYNWARLAIEDSGGYGNGVIVSLKDGVQGRPHYPALYRFRKAHRPDQVQMAEYGFPLTRSTRPRILENMAALLRERELPFITPGLANEMITFIRFNPNKPSAGGVWPRAQEGANDDRIMSMAISLELFRDRGEHPLKPKRAYQSFYSDRFGRETAPV